MKKIVSLFVILLIVGLCVADVGSSRELITYEERVGYAFGIGIADDLRENKPNTDLEFFMRGIKDLYANNSPLFSDEAVSALKWKLSGEKEKKGLSPNEKNGYEQGVNYALRISEFVPDTALDYMLKGLKDVFSDSKILLDREEALGIRSKFGKSKDKKKLHEQQQKRIIAEIEFLNNNLKKQRVIVTSSGLRYEIVKNGQGGTPKEMDKVVVEYVGKLVDGTEFVSSSRNGSKPVLVGQLISGLKEGVQLMNVGSIYRFYLPDRKAYGFNGYGNKVSSYSAVIFDIELKSVN